VFAAQLSLENNSYTAFGQVNMHNKGHSKFSAFNGAKGGSEPPSYTFSALLAGRQLTLEINIDASITIYGSFCIILMGCRYLSNTHRKVAEVGLDDGVNK